MSHVLTLGTRRSGGRPCGPERTSRSPRASAPRSICQDPSTYWRSAGLATAASSALNHRPAAVGDRQPCEDKLEDTRRGVSALGLSSANTIGSLIVFVIISLTIAGPVVSYLLGGEQAKARLDEMMKNWLALHNNGVMAVLFLVFGPKLIADGLPPFT